MSHRINQENISPFRRELNPSSQVRLTPPIQHTNHTQSSILRKPTHRTAATSRGLSSSNNMSLQDNSSSNINNTSYRCTSSSNASQNNRSTYNNSNNSLNTFINTSVNNNFNGNQSTATDHSLDRLLSSSSSSSLNRQHPSSSASKPLYIPLSSSYQGCIADNTNSNNGNSINSSAICLTESIPSSYSKVTGSALNASLSLSQIKANPINKKMPLQQSQSQNRLKQYQQLGVLGNTSYSKTGGIETPGSSVSRTSNQHSRLSQQHYDENVPMEKTAQNPPLSQCISTSKISPRLMRNHSPNNYMNSKNVPAVVNSSTDEEYVEQHTQRNKETIEAYKQREVQYLTRIHSLEQANKQMNDQIAKVESSNGGQNIISNMSAQMQQKHINMLEKYVESLSKKLSQVEGSNSSSNSCSGGSSIHSNSATNSIEADKEAYKTLLKKYMALQSIHSSIKAENSFYRNALQEFQQRDANNQLNGSNTEHQSSVMKALQTAASM